ADKLYELTAPQHEEALLQYCKHHGLSPDKLAESLNDNDVEYLCDLDAAFEVVQAIKDNNREDLLDPENMALHLHDCRDRSTWPNMSELLRKYVLKDDHTPSTANMRRISMSAAQLVAHRLDTSLCCPMGHPFRYKPAESGVYIYNPYFIPDILSLLLLSPIFQDNHKHKLNR
ncbi:MAG: hypothetical protein KDB07_03910, partial [Planctomycetes bacterium]|nr:hypothetical protein [Planctomycetota bacterium]